MSTRSAWSLCIRLVRLAIGLALVCTVLLLSSIYLVIALWNQRGGSPSNIAVAPNGTVYVSDSGRHATILNIASPCVWVIDSQNDRLVGLIKIDRGYEGIGVAPNGKVYVFPICPADHPEVVAFDPRTSRVSRIPIPRDRFTSGCFTSISFAPDGRALLRGVGWHIIDTTTDQYAGTIPSVPDWFGGAVTLDGQRAYTSYISGSYQAYQFGVRVIDTQTDTVLLDIPLPAPVVGMVPLPDGRFYALCNETDGAYYIIVVDPQTGATLKTIPLGQEPNIHYQNLGTPLLCRRMVLAPNGKVYIVRGEDFVYHGKPPGEEQGIGVYVVDPATDTVVNFIPLEPPLWDRLFPFLSVEQAVAYLGQLWAIVASSFP